MSNEVITLVTVNIQLAISSEDCNCESKEDICKYINTKLYEDRDFFGDFGEENIVDVVLEA